MVGVAAFSPGGRNSWSRSAFRRLLGPFAGHVRAAAGLRCDQFFWDWFLDWDWLRIDDFSIFGLRIEKIWESEEVEKNLNWGWEGWSNRETLGIVNYETWTNLAGLRIVRNSDGQWMILINQSSPDWAKALGIFSQISGDFHRGFWKSEHHNFKGWMWHPYIPYTQIGRNLHMLYIIYKLYIYTYYVIYIYICCIYVV